MSYPIRVTASPQGVRDSSSEGTTTLLDILSVLGCTVVFVLVGLAAKGVEKL